MFKPKTIDPVYLDDKEKVEYLANMRIGDLYPAAFVGDDPTTLISLLARRIVELENHFTSSGIRVM